MLLAAITFPNPGQIVALLLAIVLLSASIAAWAGLLIRAQLTGEIGLDWCDEPRADWTRFPERTVLALTLVLISMHLLSKLDPPQAEPDDAKPAHVRHPDVHSKLKPRPPEPVALTTDRLILNIVFTGGLAAVLVAILSCSQRSLVDYGLKWQSLGWQVVDGVYGYLLALLPMATLMFATSPFRDKHNQNALLTLLANSPDLGTVVVICFAAVMLAPVYEELLFRVVLQGWLTTVVDPRYSIPIVALIFGAIHGLPDGIALLPLTCVLGYVFHRRHSYVSVLVIHGLFNGTMLILALLIRE
ncbi:MAG: Abortive infection protein [Schlesneria sp.]|nr:Abortive infection protein [Schlesneria sp.]